MDKADGGNSGKIEIRSSKRSNRDMKLIASDHGSKRGFREALAPDDLIIEDENGRDRF